MMRRTVLAMLVAATLVAVFARGRVAERVVTTSAAPAAAPAGGCAVCPGVLLAAPVTPEMVEQAAAQRAALPSTATVLAQLGFDLGDAEASSAVAPAAIGGDDGGFISPLRARALVPRDPDRSRATTPDGAGEAGRSARRGNAANPLTIPSHWRVREGLVLVMPDADTGDSLVPGELPGDRMRISNVSGGDYSIRFQGAVKVDGLVVPENTDIPVVGQIEVELRGARGFVVMPHPSVLASPPSPSGNG